MSALKGCAEGSGVGLVWRSVLRVVKTGAGSALLARVEESVRPSVAVTKRMKTRKGIVETTSRGRGPVGDLGWPGRRRGWW